MDCYSAGYCRAVLNRDETWRLNHLIDGVKKWSLFGVDFSSLTESWGNQLFRPILKEELSPETLRDFTHESPWRESSCDRPAVRESIIRLWELLELSAESRLEFFVEHGKRSSDIVRLCNAVGALVNGDPDESDLCEVRCNPWCRAAVCRYLARKQALEAQQAATVG